MKEKMSSKNDTWINSYEMQSKDYKVIRTNTLTALNEWKNMKALKKWINNTCILASVDKPKSKKSIYEHHLLKIEQEAEKARARLKSKKQKKAQVATPVSKQPTTKPLTTSPTPQSRPTDLQEYAVIAAAMIARHGLSHDQYEKAMEAEFGPSIKPMLEDIYQLARSEFSRRMPNVEALRTAKNYAASIGIKHPGQHKYVKVDPQRAKQIADAYENSQSTPNDPKVRAAYSQLINEIEAQYAALPVKVSPWPNYDSQPYQNSREMMQDVMDNKHLWVFAGGDDHDLLTQDQNFKLRAVHDYFGHAMYGYEFGPRGEENAWIEHSKLFSPLARQALTSETRGQSNWVNFGPNSQLPMNQRPFAKQKAMILPEEFHTHEALNNMSKS